METQIDIEKQFCIDGIIEVTEGEHKGKFFVIDEIDESSPTLTCFKCSYLSGLGMDLKFDNLCARQIGILTVRQRKGGFIYKILTAFAWWILKEEKEYDLVESVENTVNEFFSKK